MAESERDLIRWLGKRLKSAIGPDEIAVGDDMAALRIDAGRLLITTDILLDGVHFQTERHSLAQIGQKAISCSLSDCAAMAVRPLIAVTSLAIPQKMGVQAAKTLLDAMAAQCKAFGCRLVGGDTTSWVNPLAVDVAMLAVPYPGIEPVRRSGARPGDEVYVTGPLGGSLLERHLAFTPRVHEAKQIAESLGPRLHAMMDISDGLAIDLDRLVEASGVGAVLDEERVLAVASDDARAAASADGRSILEHALHDGEDFELLVCAEASDSDADGLALRKVGEIVEGSGLQLRTAGGRLAPLEPLGYQHL